MADPSGPAVPDDDVLWRIIPPLARATWFPMGVLSSAAFAFPVFSTDIERLTNQNDSLARWPAGSGIVAFDCATARSLDFDPRHEPEHGNTVHANVYSSFSNNERKRRARQLASRCRIVFMPPIP
jgi:hypothetical protein